MTAPPEREPWQDLVDPDFHQVNLEIEDYLKFTRGYKLDAGTLWSSPRLSLLIPHQTTRYAGTISHLKDVPWALQHVQDATPCPPQQTLSRPHHSPTIREKKKKSTRSASILSVGCVSWATSVNSCTSIICASFRNVGGGQRMGSVRPGMSVCIIIRK